MKFPKTNHYCTFLVYCVRPYFSQVQLENKHFLLRNLNVCFQIHIVFRFFSICLKMSQNVLEGKLSEAENSLNKSLHDNSHEGLLKYFSQKQNKILKDISTNIPRKELEIPLQQFMSSYKIFVDALKNKQKKKLKKVKTECSEKIKVLLDIFEKHNKVDTDSSSEDGSSSKKPVSKDNLKFLWLWKLNNYNNN